MKEHSDNLEALLLNDSFVRWIQGSAGEQERKFWEMWRKRHPQNEKKVIEAKQILQTMQFKEEDASDMEDELEKLNKSLATKAENTPIHKFRVSRGRVFKYVAAAAILLLTALSGYFVLQQQSNLTSKQQAEVPLQTKIQEQVVQQNEVKANEPASESDSRTIATSYAEQKTLLLEDGTKVILNAQSRLQYPVDYKGEHDVTVYLEGEAYFQVERRAKSQRTFSVQTKDGTIDVLGTKFLVRTGDEETQVALKEGAVQVELMNKDIQQRQYRMKPGELAHFSQTGTSIDVAEINPDVYISWTQQKLQFDNTSLSQIVWRIEQMYGVNVVVREKSLLDKKISGSIQNKDLDILLKALSELLDTNVERQRSSIYIGT